MIELLNKMKEGYEGLAITLSMYSQNNEELNKQIAHISKVHLRRARKWQIMKR